MVCKHVNYTNCSWGPCGKIALNKISQYRRKIDQQEAKIIVGFQVNYREDVI